MPRTRITGRTVRYPAPMMFHTHWKPEQRRKLWRLLKTSRVRSAPRTLCRRCPLAVESRGRGIRLWLSNNQKELLMAMPSKPTPVRCCQHCEKRLERKRLSNGALESLLHFNRRKFCNRGCMARDFETRPKTSNPSWMTAHYHARKISPPGPCIKCGFMGQTDVHHKDGDWQNNSPENLERLCRSCHIREHRSRTCSICDKPHKGLGYCSKHYQRFKKWGNPLAVKDNQHTSLRKSGD